MKKQKIKNLNVFEVFKIFSYASREEQYGVLVMGGLGNYTELNPGFTANHMLSKKLFIFAPWCLHLQNGNE